MKKDAKKQIQKLVEKYQRVAQAGKIKSFNEAQTRNEFIEPLFEYLGWDMRNLENPGEVTTEENVSGGRVDLAFRLGNIPVFFLEAKAMKVDLDEWKWAEQAINYAWNKSVTWAVLTDFEGIKIFNAEIPPKNVARNLFIEISVHEFIDRFDQLWLLSKESFEKRLLDKEAEKWGKLTKRKQVGDKLFEDLMEWRSSLTRDFKTNNSNLTDDELDEGVQRILDRLIFIRTAEDRKIEQTILLGLLREWETKGRKHNIYKRLVDGFRWFDKNYNSKLFALHYCEEWKSSDNVFADILKGLYETKDGYRYDFSAVSADVLGGIYEQYLSFVQVRKGEDKSKSKRKSQGIYYTPKYIVDFIVNETLGEVLKKAKPKDISKIKVLDPACGSGSFLTVAYDAILDNVDNRSLFTKFDILKDNIYGVDLDAQAVEIAQLNLLLKVLSQRTKLPTLQHNLRVGNSLVSGNQDRLKEYFDEEWRSHQPFNFDEEFGEVFQNGGFDVVIGNPPYVQLSMEKELPHGLKDFLLNTYESSMGRLNTFGFFIRRGVELLRNEGYLGFIIPNTILTQDYYSELRKYILDHCSVEAIVSFDELPFKDAVVENVVIILRKIDKERTRNNNKVSIYKVIEDLSLVRDKSLTQKLFLKSHKYVFNINLDEGRLYLKKKLEDNTQPLSQFVEINQAIALRHERDKWVSDKKISEAYKPLLVGGRNINRYLISWDGTFLKYDPEGIHSGGNEEKFKAKEKIFFRRVSTHLLGALDTNLFYGLHTLVVMTAKEANLYNIRFLLGLFNSKLMNFYYRSVFASTKKVFSEIGARQVAQLPIKNIDLQNQSERKAHDQIVSMVNEITALTTELQELSPNTDKYDHLKKEVEAIDQKIDQAVYKLYGLTNEEITTIEQ